MLRPFVRLVALGALLLAALPRGAASATPSRDGWGWAHLSIDANGRVQSVDFRKISDDALADRFTSALQTLSLRPATKSGRPVTCEGSVFLTLHAVADGGFRIELELWPYVHERPVPAYPPEALRRHEQGTVLMHVTTLADGHVEKVDVVSSDAGESLTREALKTMRNWVFDPIRIDGVDQAVEFDYPMTFVLSDKDDKPTKKNHVIFTPLDRDLSHFRLEGSTTLAIPGSKEQASN